MSDPATKESKAMAQTLHLSDSPPLIFQQLSVMKVSLPLLQNIRSEPDKFVPREEQTSDLPSSRASLECSWDEKMKIPPSEDQDLLAHANEVLPSGCDATDETPVCWLS